MLINLKKVDKYKLRCHHRDSSDMHNDAFTHTSQKHGQIKMGL